MSLRKKPWNRINLPVYALSSKDAHGQFNMHIVTYATAISMHPKRFVCGIYHGTQSLANIQACPQFVLQLLDEKEVNLITLLGKQSGRHINKIEKLEKRKKITDWNGFKILNNCLAAIEMKVINSFSGGDHECFLCDVVSYKNFKEGSVLTLDHLREKKIIRI